MRIETLPVGKIKAAKYNPRKDLKPAYPEYQKLKRSIETFGYVDLLVVNERTGRLIGGHQRLKVLKDLGYTEVECSIVSLDDDQEKALNITLNKIEGAWDFSTLADLLLELDAANFDLDLTGFDSAEINKIMDWSPTDGEGNPKDFKEYDESAADEVKYHECPECGHKWPK